MPPEGKTLMILRELSKGPKAPRTLAQVVALSEWKVRERLRALEEIGVVCFTCGPSEGPGRPARMYELSRDPTVQLMLFGKLAN